MGVLLEFQYNDNDNEEDGDDIDNERERKQRSERSTYVQVPIVQTGSEQRVEEGAAEAANHERTSTRSKSASASCKPDRRAVRLTGTYVVGRTDFEIKRQKI